VSLHDLARRMAALAIAAVDPERLVRAALERREMAGQAGAQLDAVLAAGKAAAGLARGARSAAAGAFAASPRRFLARPHSSPALLDPGWEQATGGHPVPDRQSAAAGARLQGWLSRIDREQTLLALVSGGASACLEVPGDGLSLDDVAATYRALLDSGLPIGTVNAVRKHLSAIKGGGALRSTPGKVLALLLSDVPDDDPSIIGSGLFAADPTFHEEALQALQGLDVPAAVLRHLEAGVRGHVPETLKPGDPELARVETVVIGSARTAVTAVAGEARRQGFRTQQGKLAGEAAQAARDLVERGRSLEGEQVAVVWGGETTVALAGSGGGSGGRGGRNIELALAAAGALHGGLPGCHELVLALATDGEDGTTRKAGALVDGGAWEAVRRGGIDPAAALARHEAFRALSSVAGALLETGPTGTNVGDLAIYLRSPA
jgi:glycerate 2-kinase